MKRSKSKPGPRWIECCSRTCGNRRRAGKPLGIDDKEWRWSYEQPRVLALSRARRTRHGHTWDGISDATILERDGWRCHICRRKINPRWRYPDPRSKSIDHIVPLSQGGDDTEANKRAAHLGCNLARGNRGGNEQLRLVG